MSVFTKPIDNISYDDVVSFCQQRIGEGISLDYKKDFPRSLGETISAFANSFGGVIIIGVKEDESSKPKPPFEGIDHEDKLEERVWNIILDNIYPPLFPEIRVCPPKDGKTFVVIRIPQSNETPHAIYNNTKVYIRTGNRSKLEDLATVEQIEWLRNRRKKSEELREMLYRRAEDRYRTICEQRHVSAGFGEFALSFCPLYLQKPLVALEQIERIVNEAKVSDRYATFPKLWDSPRPVQDGIVSYGIRGETRVIAYTEVNRFGMVFYKKVLEEIDNTPGTEAKKKLHIISIVDILRVAFEAMAAFYDKIGYWGLVEVKFSVGSILGVSFIPPRAIYALEDLIEKNDVQKVVSWQIVVSVPELKDSAVRRSKLVDTVKDITWSFGQQMAEENINELLRGDS